MLDSSTRMRLLLVPCREDDDEGLPEAGARTLDMNVGGELSAPRMVLYRFYPIHTEGDCSGDIPEVAAVCQHDGGSGLDLLSDLEEGCEASPGRPEAKEVEVERANASRPKQKLNVSLLSVGSAGHASGSCRPCAHFSRSGCHKGYDCEFCHSCTYEAFLEYKSRRKLRKRQFVKGRSSEDRKL
eukprot:TRINITY_DN67232_c0_g1_i1.p1 TRINITY_DN67232_c0_g1~~TRINITY_DN67232_c0_g1_i1.p1  ORF type:complete len:184 (-),score=17.33 TRINITY_DN67232_c0_g1_i1:285-836(-)